LHHGQVEERFGEVLFGSGSKPVLRQCEIRRQALTFTHGKIELSECVALLR
jgi:hypothetical protein